MGVHCSAETTFIAMKSSFLFLFLAFSNVFGIEYDKIVAIKTITADDEDSGMDLSKGSYIGVEVYGHYGDLECEIAKLYHQETGGEGDFAPGQQDGFEGRDLHACENEEVIWYPAVSQKSELSTVGMMDGVSTTSLSILMIALTFLVVTEKKSLLQMKNL